LPTGCAGAGSSPAHLAEQPALSLWTTEESYKPARFGMDWLTWLMMRHGHGHWCPALDADPKLWCGASTRLTGWRQLEARGLMSRGGWV
jgi:hypothetical protein